jgi:hypothetical protein
MIRKFIYLILTTMLVGAAAAQDVSIRSDHPQEYVVVEGDTLWDISSRFLDKPWQWPAIWHANPQVENPHLIFPGDRLSLIYEDGKARLMVNRGKSIKRLSPETRVTSRSAVSSIPMDVLRPFIRNARVINHEQYDEMPYVVANYEQRINATHRDRTYVRALDAEVGDRVAIVRLGNIYYTMSGEKRRGRDANDWTKLTKPLTVPTGFWRPVNTWGKNVDIIGYEMVEIAEAVVAKTGDPAILEIISDEIEIQEGDRIMPLDDHTWQDQFDPQPMESMPEGLKVLAVEGGNYGVGHFQMVSISGGSNQGVEPGHVFSAFSPSVVVRDNVKYPAGSWADMGAWSGDKVDLPAEYAAHIMVIRTFGEVSYAMVMQGDRLVSEFDILRHADETL